MITPIYILAIESSCDDTAAAVIRDGAPLSNCVATQEIHRLYGGVVPEVASRAHQSNIIPVVHAALAQAGVAKHEINAVSYTNVPLCGGIWVAFS